MTGCTDPVAPNLRRPIAAVSTLAPGGRQRTAPLGECAERVLDDDEAQVRHLADGAGETTGDAELPAIDRPVEGVGTRLPK